MIEHRIVEEWARRLRAAELTGEPLALVTEEHPDLAWNDARAIARARDALRRADGDEQIGYKLGWTSEPMRLALGISQPNWGTLWRSQMSGAQFSLDRLWHPKVEPELVYRTMEPLSGSDVDETQIRNACDGWALGLEFVHPRFATFRFTWLDNTADNSSGERVVVGEFGDLDIDPAEVAVTFTGTEVRDGVGASAMASPISAVTWLVRSLASEGLGLATGDLVFTGGLAAPFDVTPGATYRLESDSLEPVAVTATPG